MYREIVFMQGEEADNVLKWINKGQHRKAANYLMQWNYGEGMEYEYNPAGEADCIKILKYGQEKFQLSWNSRYGYVSLTEILKG